MTYVKSGTSMVILALAIIAAMGLVTPSLAAYSLVWSDEFDGTSLDTSNWTPDIGNGCPSLCGWGNGELEYYRSQNVTVSGGNLVLTALEQSYGGYSYTSGKVHTRGKHSFLYGRIEMRAKIPTGGGMWPAFWMMPEDNVYGGWALSGEIDIMESANNTTTVGNALHFGGAWPDNRSTTGSYSLGGTNFADDFHIYAVEWEADVMRWYVDGVLYSVKNSAQWYSDAAPSNPLAPFDQEFYIILNTAVGGYYTGCTDPGCITASFPQEYLIDYVRVYQDTPNEAPTVAITSPNEGDELPVGDIIIEATASDIDGTIATVEFYNGAIYLGEDTTAPYAYTWTSAPGGCYSIIAKAIDNVGAMFTDTVNITVGDGCGRGPFYGTPFVLPTKIQAEDFDLGGQNVAYYDQDLGNNGGEYRLNEDVDIEVCYDTDGGYGVGWIDAGERIEYSISVPTAGSYTVETRVSSLQNGGTFHLEFDGVDLTGTVTVPVTTGWQTWVTVTASVALPAGEQIMKFVPGATGFNINSFEFIADLSPVLPDAQGSGYALHPCYPNPFNPMTTISYDLPTPSTVTLAIYDIAGKLVKTLVAAESYGAGNHEVVWHGRNDAGQVVSAGVYFYRLDAGEFSETRRMTLVK